MKHKILIYGLIIGVFVLGGLQDALALGVWTPATPMPIGNGGNLVQCADQPDSLYRIGGVIKYNETTNRVARYDILTGKWIRLTNMPKALRSLAVTCYEGKIYAAGGLAKNGVTISNALYIYDIATKTWSSGAKLPDAVWGAAMGVWEGRLYLVGGTRTGPPYTPESRVDVYNIASNKWTAGDGAVMPSAASFAASAQNGAYLYVVGGISGDFENNVNQTQRYNMSTDTWSAGPVFTSARALGGLAITSSSLYVLGGDANGGTAFDITDLVEVLDLSDWPSGAWVDLGLPLPAANIYPATGCTETLGGEIWDVGGADSLLIAYTEVYYLLIDEGCP